MSDPIDVGAAIREIKARTGWTWRAVADQLGTTPEYARKLATKPTSSGAGRALEANVRAYTTTGAAQAPVQRAQRVRQPGGAPSAPAAHRAPVLGRQAFHGGARDGWQVTVNAKGPGADREVLDAVRHAAYGRRRVSFVITTDANPRPVELFGGARAHTRGGRFAGAGGVQSSTALANMRHQGALAWLAAQLDQHATYGTVPGELETVTVIALP